MWISNPKPLDNGIAHGVAGIRDRQNPHRFPLCALLSHLQCPAESSWFENATLGVPEDPQTSWGHVPLRLRFSGTWAFRS